MSREAGWVILVTSYTSYIWVILLPAILDYQAFGEYLSCLHSLNVGVHLLNVKEILGYISCKNFQVFFPTPLLQYEFLGSTDPCVCTEPAFTEGTT